jgi:mxaJ protein
MAGYFVKKLNASFLELVPLSSSGAIPFAYDVSMGVRKGDRELKASLEQVLDRNQRAIRKILEDFGVPLVAEGTPGSDRGSTAPSDGRREGAGHQHQRQ